jgi:hypothetical protein
MRVLLALLCLLTLATSAHAECAWVRWVEWTSFRIIYSEDLPSLDGRSTSSLTAVT